MSTCTVCLKEFEFMKESSGLGHDGCIAIESIKRLNERQRTWTRAYRLRMGIDDDVVKRMYERTT